MSNSKIQRHFSLAAKMGTALFTGIICGAGFLFTREYLLNNGYSHIWNTIDSLLFRDITLSENVKAVGLFFILGQMFINCLQFIIVPLIFSSIVLAICRIKDTKKFGRIAVQTISNFLTMYAFALCLASAAGFTAYKVGIFKSVAEGTSEKIISQNINPLTIILNCVPSNIFNVFSTNSQILSIVFLAVITGICLNIMENEKDNKEKTVVYKFLFEVNKIVSIFLTFVIDKFSAPAIFFLITRTFAIYGTDHLKPVVAYLGVTTAALIIFLIFGYPAYIFFKARLNPVIFMKKISKAALLGTSAASSAAALSLNEKICREELGIDEEVVSFVLPLGMTINMNGTTIMQIIGTIFIASSAGYEITFSSLMSIAFLALIGAVGTPSIPSSSTIILFSILNGMGYNNDAVYIIYSLIVAMNRPLDMLATALNVTGDSAAALIISEKENILDKNIYYKNFNN